MKKHFKSGICILVAFVAAMSAFALTGCLGFDYVPEPLDPAGIFTQDDFIEVFDDKLRTERGDIIALRGVNAGGVLVTEQWMNAMIDTTGHSDHKTATEVFVKRFGIEKTLELWNVYRENAWTDQDFQNCVDMGINHIRLPFTYMNVDPEYNNVEYTEKKYNFRVLDEFVAKAAAYGLYTILDLHGAYGSQNGQDHSGETFDSVSEVDFYSNEEKMSQTIDLWRAVAENFAGNPAVAGYDLLNEPGEKAGTTTTRHFVFFDRVYDAIREVDSDHVIIIESCWDGKDLPRPKEYGWEKVMYSFHHYTSDPNYDSHMRSWRSKVAEIKSMKFGVPVYLGEFCCYGNEQSWVDTLQLMNGEGWSYASWTYKINITGKNTSNAWGVYRSATDSVYIHEDTYDTIVEKWKGINTADERSYAFAFKSGKTLAQVIKENIGLAVEE